MKIRLSVAQQPRWGRHAGRIARAFVREWVGFLLRWLVGCVFGRIGSELGYVVGSERQRWQRYRWDRSR